MIINNCTLSLNHFWQKCHKKEVNWLNSKKIDSCNSSYAIDDENKYFGARFEYKIGNSPDEFSNRAIELSNGKSIFSSVYLAQGEDGEEVYGILFR